MDLGRVRLLAIAALLGLYIAPLVAGAGASLFGGLKGTEPVGRMMLALIAVPDSPPAILQKLLVPLTAGVTVAALWSSKNSKLAIALLTACAIGLIATMIIWVNLLEEDSARNLYQTATISDFKNDEEFYKYRDVFIRSVTESLVTYIAILLGIQAPQNRTRGRGQ